ncbi:MAG TPA: MEDS domain-containing protein [Pseudonocardia sp.]|uniref:MEDS domain-containing protein n=1 Tax=Pseudonocardia sp. TaxID=60912 RepID=UPI002ED98352
MSKALVEIALGDHACVVMDSDEQHWEIAAGFVAEGIQRGEKIIYYDGARSTEPVLRRLREDNVDVEHYLRTGQLAVFGPELTNQLWKLSLPEMAGLVAQTIGRSLAEGYTSVRVTDEPSGAVHRPSGHSLAEYDRAVHESMRGHPVTLLCQYERTDWPTSELTDLCEMHSIEVVTPAIYDDGLLRITREAPFSTRVSGEIDFSNRHLVRSIIDKELDRALRTADQTEEIQVHLESLRFADVTTIVQFVQAAEGFPQSHKLVLYGVQPCIRRVLDRCGAGFTAQLTLREAMTA